MPNPILTELARVEHQIRSARHLWIGCDYDGTLAPYSDDPSEHTLTSVCRELLHDLASQENVQLAIISGRDIRNLREQVRLHSLAYAGNHGLEIELDAERFVHPRAIQCQGSLQELAKRLSEHLPALPGSHLQDKGLSLTVHCREVATHHQDDLQRIITEHVHGLPELTVHSSMHAWDIRPTVDWHKGSAVNWLRERQASPGALAIVLGDDRSDEDAFAAAADGITIRVGSPRPTNARYSLKSQGEVHGFLELLTKWVRG